MSSFCLFCDSCDSSLIVFIIERTQPDLFWCRSRWLSLKFRLQYIVVTAVTNSLKMENLMNIDEIFKKMETVDLASEEKRNPTRPAEKSIMENLSEKLTLATHRYGPEYLPLKILPECPASKFQGKEPLAFCENCNADKPMKWKSPEKRGETVDSWFSCAICDCNTLKIKMIRKEMPK